RALASISAGRCASRVDRQRRCVEVCGPARRWPNGQDGAVSSDPLSNNPVLRVPVTIDSPANPRIKAAVRLRERDERQTTGLTLVDGGREALRAMESGAMVESAFICPPLLSTREAKRVAEKLSQSFGPFGASIEVSEVSERAFERVAYGDRADGVVLVVRAPRTELADLELP